MTTAGKIILPYGTAPDTPASGKLAIYSKDDKFLYYKDDDGNEYAVTASGTFVSTLLDLIDTPAVYSDGKYLKSTASGTEWAIAVSDHGALTGLGDDDHTQYILTDGTRAFSATISGITPTADPHLTTKSYVDTAITTATGSLTTYHSDLNELDYASAAHTGFASAAALATTSGVLDDKISTSVKTAVTYYLHEEIVPSPPAGHETLSPLPSDDVESYDSVVIDSGDGETEMDHYVTLSGTPNVTSITAGTWTMILWADVSATSQGPHYVRAKWFIHEQDETHRYLFTQEAQITSTTPSRYVVETSVSGINMNTGDRLEVIMYAETSSGPTRTIGYYVEGVDRTTRFNTPVYADIITDHGELTGLDDDDHTQYHTDARGDARYYTETEVDTISGSINTDIEANTSLISTNTSNITSNTESIAVVSGTADTNTTNITTLQSDFTSHSGTLDIHRELDDGSTTTTNLWSANKITTYIDESTTVSGGEGEVGRYTLASGVSTGTISFIANFDDTTYSTHITLENTVDDIVSLYDAIVTNTTVSGFDFELIGTTDSTNYVLCWTAMDTVGNTLGYTQLNPTPNNGVGSGDIATMTVDENSYGFAGALHMDIDSNWINAKADSTTTMPCSALALEGGTGSIRVLLRGFVTNTGWDWTPGETVYVSTTSGTLTATAPSASGELVQIVGIATHADRLWFMPSYNLVEVD